MAHLDGVPALKSLFELHGPGVHRRAVSVVGDPALAREVLQRTFIRVIWERASLPRDDLTRWLYPQTTALSLEALRGRDKRPSSPPSQLPGLSALRPLLVGRPDREATAAVYRYVDRMPTGEVAELIDAPQARIEELDRRFRSAAGDAQAALDALLAGTEGCPSDYQLDRMYVGELDAGSGETAELRAHVNRCSHCKSQLAMRAEGFGVNVEMVTVLQRVVKRWPRGDGTPVEEPPSAHKLRKPPARIPLRAPGPVPLEPAAAALQGAEPRSRQTNPSSRPPEEAPAHQRDPNSIVELMEQGMEPSSEASTPSPGAAPTALDSLRGWFEALSSDAKVRVVVGAVVLLFGAVVALLRLLASEGDEGAPETGDKAFRLELVRNDGSEDGDAIRFRATLPTFGRLAIYGHDRAGKLRRVWPSDEQPTAAWGRGPDQLLPGAFSLAEQPDGAPFTMVLCSTSVVDPGCELGEDGQPACQGLCRLTTAPYPEN